MGWCVGHAIGRSGMRREAPKQRSEVATQGDKELRNDHRPSGSTHIGSVLRVAHWAMAPSDSQAARDRPVGRLRAPSVAPPPTVSAGRQRPRLAAAAMAFRSGDLQRHHCQAVFAGKAAMKLSRKLSLPNPSALARQGQPPGWQPPTTTRLRWTRHGLVVPVRRCWLGRGSRQTGNLRRRCGRAGAEVQLVVGDCRDCRQEPDNAKPSGKSHAAPHHPGHLARLPNSVLRLMRRFNRDQHQVLNLHVIMTETVGDVAQQLHRLLEITAHRQAGSATTQALILRRMRPAQQRRILSGAFQQQASYHFAGRSRETTLRRIDHVRLPTTTRRCPQGPVVPLGPSVPGWRANSYSNCRYREPQTGAARPVTSGRARFGSPGPLPAPAQKPPSARSVPNRRPNSEEADRCATPPGATQTLNDPFAATSASPFRPWMKRPVRQA